MEIQISALKERYGSYWDLIDIGTFEGETLLGEINGRFKEEGVDIGNVYLAFAEEEGISNLQDGGVRPFARYKHHWVDWLEIRDCFGFDGRKVNCDLENIPLPANLFVKYTEKSEKWASIPPQIKQNYEELYCTYFNLLKSCLRTEGYDLSLEQYSEDFEYVYRLDIWGAK